MANDLTYYLNTEMSDKLSGDFDGYFWIENLDSQPHRFKMVPLNDSEVPNHYSAQDTNPTLIEHQDGSLTFCLAPKEFVFTCTVGEAQQYVVLYKARDSLPFLTFANVAFNIFENGIQIGNELSLLNISAMHEIGLEIHVEDSGNKRIRIFNTNSGNPRSMEFHPTMGIINDVDIIEGNAVIHNGSFFMCLAPVALP